MKEALPRSGFNERDKTAARMVVVALIDEAKLS